MEGSRPQSAIKKKSNGISPNSKAAKQLHLINSIGVGGKVVGTTGKQVSSGKAYQNNSKYDPLNPKYIAFKSRDSQHKKTNSYSMGGFAGSMSSYQKSSKAKNLNVIPGGVGPLDSYQIHSATNQNMYTTTIGTANDTHGMTFIEQADLN